jgi:uncharacterized membrane protein YesL
MPQPTTQEGGMSKTAFTIKAFGGYLLLLGVGLVLAPNLLLSLLGVPQTTEVWIRVLGVVVITEGAYYWAAAQGEAIAFFRASVLARPLVLLGFAAFALLGLASPVLVLFGGVDAAGALWTWLTMKSERREGQRAYPPSRIDPRYESRM